MESAVEFIEGRFNIKLTPDQIAYLERMESDSFVKDGIGKPLKVLKGRELDSPR